MNERFLNFSFKCNQIYYHTLSDIDHLRQHLPSYQTIVSIKAIVIFQKFLILSVSFFKFIQMCKPGCKITINGSVTKPMEIYAAISNPLTRRISQRGQMVLI